MSLLYKINFVRALTCVITLDNYMDICIMYLLKNNYVQKYFSVSRAF